MAPPKVSLKLLIDNKGQRVLFAEAGKDFIDFLFSLLTLPLATVMKLLPDKNATGGISNLYQSVSDLNDDYIQSHQQKDTLLNPKSSPQLPLLPIVEESSTSASPVPAKTPSTMTLYKCPGIFCKRGLYAPDKRSCPYCGCTMTAVADTCYVVKAKEGSGFVKGLVTYMVMDDLVVSPMSTISSVTLLNKFNVKDLGVLEEKVVYIGMEEGLELLKNSLNSNTVLTNVFLGKVAGKYDT